MAIVCAPLTAPQLPPLKRQITVSSGSSSLRAEYPYYGYKETAELSARFVTHLFACPDLPSRSACVALAPPPPLANFIAYALCRAQLHSSVMFSALYLLQRLKYRFPTVQGSSGHRLFLTAFMIAAKGIYDATYSNPSWSMIAQKMFTLPEINQMEREMCSYLRWQLYIDQNTLKSFEEKVRHDFQGLGPYPTYVLPCSAPSPMPSTTPHTVQADTDTPALSITACSQQPQSTSPPKPIPTYTSARPYSVSSQPHTAETADTPKSSMSTATSPASSVSSSTPTRYEGHSVGASSRGATGTPITVNSQPLTMTSHTPGASSSNAAFAYAYVAVCNTPAVLKKEKCADIFARASPCIW